MKRALIPGPDPETSADSALVTHGHTAVPGRLVEAGSDRDIVAAWLMEYRASPQTFRQYRKEAERLLLWLERQGRQLTDLDRRALDDFEQFLADPRPVAEWIGPPRPRHSDQWRPFRKGLSAASRRQSLVILQTLFGWLIEAGWLRQNPFRLMRDKRRRMDNATAGIERYIERALWQWCWQRLDTAPAEVIDRAQYEFERRRLVFAFAYLLAPRVSEMSHARMQDFQRYEGQWWWQVTGKGDKRASIPVPDAMMGALMQWRGVLGLPATPSPEEDTPVIRALDGKRGVGDNQLYRLIKTAFESLAREKEQQGDAAAGHEAQRLRRATPHWLRHTAITHQAQQGVELRYLARTARHARLETTARYLHAETQEWHGQINRHRLDPSDEPGDDTL